MRAPEVEDGEEPTAAADTYALGVAMFKMLTGVWYEPGVDVRALLAGGRWKYRWAEILPAMLAVEPAERPQILAQAVIGLLPSAKRTQDAVMSRTRRRRWAWVVAACVCTALVAIGGLCAGVVAWRALKGGYEGLDSLESTLLDGCPLCVVADRESAAAFCRAMTERVRASLPDGYEVRLATEEELHIVLAEEETARLCEATGRSVDDCVEPSGAIACARFRRMKADCRLERFGGWTKNGELVGKRAVVAGLAMPRASGIVGLCKGEADTIPWHLVVGRKLTDGQSEMEVFNGRQER